MHPRLRRIVAAGVFAIAMALGGAKVLAYESFDTGVDFWTIGHCVGSMATVASAHAWVADPSTIRAWASTPMGFVVIGEVSGTGFLDLGPVYSTSGYEQPITMCMWVDTPAWYGTYWDLTYTIN